MLPYLAFLRRHFAGVLRDANRIFVLHHPQVTSPAHALPVLRRLRRYGNNSLLYVTAGAATAAGSVVQERARLFHGHIDRLARMEEAFTMDVPGWVSVCTNAYRLWREAGAY
jgi:hypothetical protein